MRALDDQGSTRIATTAQHKCACGARAPPSRPAPPPHVALGLGQVLAAAEHSVVGAAHALAALEQGVHHHAAAANVLLQGGQEQQRGGGWQGQASGEAGSARRQPSRWEWVGGLRPASAQQVRAWATLGSGPAHGHARAPGRPTHPGRRRSPSTCPWWASGPRTHGTPGRCGPAGGRGAAMRRPRREALRNPSRLQPLHVQCPPRQPEARCRARAISTLCAMDQVARVETCAKLDQLAR